MLPKLVISTTDLFATNTSRKKETCSKQKNNVASTVVLITTPCILLKPHNLYSLKALSLKIYYFNKIIILLKSACLYGLVNNHAHFQCLNLIFLNVSLENIIC